jgi:nitrilase
MTFAAAIQMASGPNMNANLIEAARLINDAVAKDARLVVLPENFAMMGMKDVDNLAHTEKPGKGPIQEFLSQQAAKHKIWLVGGTLPMESQNDGKAYSSCLVFDESGSQVTEYKKIHLFDVRIHATGEKYTESETILPGEDIVVIDSPFGKMGIAICYDLRFPELFRKMLDMGAQLFVVPSAFTAITGKAHWEVLCRGRAIENLAYLVAAAQGGYHVSGRETYGHSMIVDPWGQVLDCLPHGSGFVMADIDINHVESIRRNFPAVEHRRLKCDI